MIASKFKVGDYIKRRNLIGLESLTKEDHEWFSEPRRVIKVDQWQICHIEPPPSARDRRFPSWSIDEDFWDVYTLDWNGDDADCI